LEAEDLEVDALEAIIKVLPRDFLGEDHRD